MFGSTVLAGLLFQLRLVSVSLCAKTTEHYYLFKVRRDSEGTRSSFHMILVSVFLSLLVLWLRHYVKLVESFISFAMHFA